MYYRDDGHRVMFNLEGLTRMWAVAQELESIPLEATVSTPHIPYIPQQRRLDTLWTFVIPDKEAREKFRQNIRPYERPNSAQLRVNMRQEVFWLDVVRRLKPDLTQPRLISKDPMPTHHYPINSETGTYRRRRRPVRAGSQTP